MTYEETKQQEADHLARRQRVNAEEEEILAKHDRDYPLALKDALWRKDEIETELKECRSTLTQE